MTAAVSAALVLFLAAALFTGAAGAVQITASEWNELDAAGINGNTSYQFYGTGIIYPKFNSSAVFIPNHDITFDFTSYQGIFSGDQVADNGYRGALFGSISNTSTAITLTFNNLTLTSVNVTTGSGSYVGGIVGFFEGKSSGESRLLFENCHIVNCSISGGKSVGGLVGGTKAAAVTAENCCVEHCDAVSNNANVGGLVGYADTSVSVINNSTVANSTVASTGKQNAGGLVGYAESASFENCSVKNTSVYASAAGESWGNTGGLAGDAKYVTRADNCTVINCVIASGSGRAGGLVGYSKNTVSNLGNNRVVNCTVAGPEDVGGLVGKAGSVVGSADNDVLNSAVNGSSLFGADCDAVKGSFTGSENGTVIYYQFPYPGTTPLERSNSAFWNLISWGGTDAGVSGMHTLLGTYAVSGGYGVGSYIPPAAYTATYNANDADSGTVPVDSAKYSANAEVSVPGNPGSLAKTGFVFNGWNLGSATGELKKEGDTFTITEDTTLYANWTASVKPAYVEVSDWDTLVQNASGWTDKETMRTIVLTNKTEGAYRNVTGTAGNYGGIPITGNITIMSKDTGGADEIKIDANGMGRIFNVTSGANLTLAGNSSTVLNVTGGYVFGTSNNGGGVLVNNGGNFTIAADAKITNCSVGNTCRGGGVYNLGMFTLLHGTIDNCCGSYGGGVYIIGAFTMSGGSIINCSATQFGGGVYCEERFTMDGESSIINCSASNGGSGGGTGGGVFVKSGGTFSMDDSSIINCRAGGNGGGVSIAAGGIFSMDGSNIVNCSTDCDGGGVENQGTFTLSESTIKDCYATGSFGKGGSGGGGGVMNYGVFTMASGLLDNCSTGKNGGGVCNKGSSFTMNGSALVNDAVYLASGKNITLGDGGFAAGNYGAKNITLAGDAAGWLGHTIVKDGKDNASYFTLSQAITGYALAAGTGDQENDLVLAEYKSPYVEVNDWDALVAAASGWTEKENMRTIVLINTTEGAYKNMTGDAGDDWPGIPVTGNITIMPNSSVTASEIKIDANQKGRLFDV
ncbi:MAG TPA: InlB B-repeat-containing protein, partial [Methanocorpusculum sp.]|nr:InlB B-repeat-containing protein [Methanocorpusculum sp.]